MPALYALAQHDALCDVQSKLQDGEAALAFLDDVVRALYDASVVMKARRASGTPLAKSCPRLLTLAEPRGACLGPAARNQGLPLEPRSRALRALARPMSGSGGPRPPAPSWPAGQHCSPCPQPAPSWPPFRAARCQRRQRRRATARRQSRYLQRLAALTREARTNSPALGPARSSRKTEARGEKPKSLGEEDVKVAAACVYLGETTSRLLTQAQTHLCFFQGCSFLHV